MEIKIFRIKATLRYKNIGGVIRINIFPPVQIFKGHVLLINIVDFLFSFPQFQIKIHRVASFRQIVRHCVHIVPNGYARPFVKMSIQ